MSITYRNATDSDDNHWLSKFWRLTSTLAFSYSCKWILLIYVCIYFKIERIYNKKTLTNNVPNPNCSKMTSNSPFELLPKSHICNKSVQNERPNIYRFTVLLVGNINTSIENRLTIGQRIHLYLPNFFEILYYAIKANSHKFLLQGDERIWTVKRQELEIKNDIRKENIKEPRENF